MSDFTSGGVRISLEIMAPPSPGPHPAVVIAYGTRGMTDQFGKMIRELAGSLVEAGFVAAIPHYFERSGTPASTSVAGDFAVLEAFLMHRSAWLGTLRDSIETLAERPEVREDRIGVLGLSMGGYLALQTAIDLAPQLGVVIDFFGPITMRPFNGLQGSINLLPPVQIHHGTNDQIVSVSESTALGQALASAGKAVELHLYSGEGHPFTGAPAIALSTSRVVDFCRQNLPSPCRTGAAA